MVCLFFVPLIIVFWVYPGSSPTVRPCRADTGLWLFLQTPPPLWTYSDVRHGQVSYREQETPALDLIPQSSFSAAYWLCNLSRTLLALCLSFHTGQVEIIYQQQPPWLLKGWNEVRSVRHTPECLVRGPWGRGSQGWAILEGSVHFSSPQWMKLRGCIVSKNIALHLKTLTRSNSG